MAKETKTTGAPQPKKEEQYNWQTPGTPTGFENTNPEDLGIPFLTILQKGSPEVDGSHPDHAAKAIEGATAGCIINTMTREILYKPNAKTPPPPVIVVPCFHEKLFPEWKPRTTGGGFVKHHDSNAILMQCTRNEKNQDVLPNGNLIVTTAYFYLLIPKQNEEPQKVVLSMTSTQLKKARAWLNMMSSLKITGGNGNKFTPPMFSHTYALTTIAESNDSGSWFGWSIEIDDMVKDRELIAASIEVAKKASTVQRPQLGNGKADTDALPM